MCRKLIEMLHKPNISLIIFIKIIWALLTSVIVIILMVDFVEGIISIENPLLIKIISIFLGFSITALYSSVVKFSESYHGWMTGNWTLTIYDDTNNVIKEDLYMVVHRKNNIFADIIRTFPKDSAELGRNWTFQGRLINNTKLIGYYWSQKEGSSSCGAQFLLNVEKKGNTQPMDGHIFKGTYIKANVLKLDGEGKFLMDPDQIPMTTITWERPATNLDDYKSILNNRPSAVRRVLSKYLPD